MKKTIFVFLVLTMFGFSVNSAQAFVFSDIPAQIQRAIEFLKTTQGRVEDVTHYKKFVDHAKEFNKLRNEFTAYQQQFDRMYKNISRGTYASAFNVTKWDWTKLDQHIINSYQAWDRAWYDAQMMLVRTSRMYQNNPIYRRFVDETDEINLEIMMIDEEESKFLKDSNDRIKELMEDRNKVQKLIDEIATGEFASGDNQQIAIQAATARMSGIDLQHNLEEANKRNVEKGFSAKKLALANKALEKQTKMSAENIENADVAKEISNLDAWAGKVRACAVDPKSAACVKR